MPSADFLKNRSLNGEFDDSIARLRRLIYDLVNEVEMVDEKSLSLFNVSLLRNRDGISLYEEVRRFEIALIQSALRRTDGHQIEAARLLNLLPSTLNSKIKQYDIR